MHEDTIPTTTESLRARATAMFAAIRERAMSCLHSLEDAAGPPLYPESPGRFARSAWRRAAPDATEDLGGGEMGLLHGRLFEKAGIHISTVYGPLTGALAEALQNTSQTFWAAGVSIIIHPLSPKIPATHMNVRMISADTIWFGGGADLTPLLPEQRVDTDIDTTDFHAAMKNACATNEAADYQAFAANCDRYFHLPHRDEPRGTGGIFFDRLASGDSLADLRFLQATADAFIDVYETIVRRRMAQSWSTAERDEQLRQRGRYAEFNLLYDRGTRFGLASGGNITAILSSLPPMVTWR